MTKDRAKQICFEVIQLFRQKAELDGKDMTDFDDWLFSELDIETRELAEIYSNYKGISVYAGSCYKDGCSPKNYDRVYFSH